MGRAMRGLAEPLLLPQQRHISLQEALFLDPIARYRQYKQWPVALGVHVLLVVLFLWVCQPPQPTLF